MIKLTQKSKGVVPILIVLITALALGGFYIYQKILTLTPSKQISKSSPTPTSLQLSSPTSTPMKTSWKTYHNEEHGFSFRFPSEWGDITEGWEVPPEESSVGAGYQLILQFSNLQNYPQKKMKVGGASNDFSAGRGPIFQDVSDSDWHALLTLCTTRPRDIVCEDDNIINKRVISRLVFPSLFTDSYIPQFEKLGLSSVHMPQYFNRHFTKNAYFNIYNAKISILGFEYDFVANYDELQKTLNQLFPNYVKILKSKKFDFKIEDAKAYDEDVRKMKLLFEKGEFPFDDITKKNIADFDTLVSSFKFLK